MEQRPVDDALEFAQYAMDNLKMAIVHLGTANGGSDSRYEDVAREVRRLRWRLDRRMREE